MSKGGYPAEGDPWADFLHHRARVIEMFYKEGKSRYEIAQTLSMDPRQVELIHMSAEAKVVAP